MFSQFRPRSAYDVMAALSLFIVIGGTSYAAITLPKNSVGSKQIKPGAIKASELSRRSVTSQKVKDRSLLSKDFKAGQLPSGPRGPQGATGPAGSVGAQGAPGAPAASAFSARFPSVLGGGYGPITGVGPGASSENAVHQLSPAAPMIARDLSARHIDDAGGAGSIRGFILRVNGTDTALSCTFTKPGDSCQNTGDAVPVPPGSLLSIRTTQGGASITGSGYVVVSWRGTTP